MSSLNDIQGTNCRFQILVGDDYLDLICAKNFRMAMVTDIKETTTVGSGFWKEHRPKKLSYTLSMSGLVQVVEEQNRPVIANMLEMQKGFLPMGFRLLYIDNDDNPLILRGTVYITSSEISADPIALLDGSLQMLGTGELLIEYEIPVYIDMTVQVTGIANAKAKFFLTNANGELVYNTDSLDATQPNGGWLVQGQTIVFNVLSGMYYWGMQVQDANSDDNDFDLNTPAPGPAHIDFDHNPVSAGSYPSQLHDFTADRLAVFTIGEALPPPPCVPVEISGSPALPDGQLDVAYSYSFGLTGTAPFNLTVNDRPAWMDIQIIGSTVFFTGTPDVADTGITVDIDISNCGEEPVNFTDTFDIDEPAEVSFRVGQNFNAGEPTNPDESVTVYVSTNGGANWTAIGSVLPDQVSPYALVPATWNTVIGQGFLFGVLKTTNGQNVSNGVAGSSAFAQCGTISNPQNQTVSSASQTFSIWIDWDASGVIATCP